MKFFLILVRISFLLAASSCDYTTVVEKDSTMATSNSDPFFSHFEGKASKLGSSQIIQPSIIWSVPPLGLYPTAFGVRGGLVPLLQVSVPDEDASLVTVNCRSEYETTQDSRGNVVPAVGSPAVAVIQWGTGGGRHELEFDIPSAKFPMYMPLGGFPAENQPLSIMGNGVCFTVAASHVTVSVRHDGGLNPLNNLGGDFIGDLRPIRASCFIGPGSNTSLTQVKRSIVAVGGTSLFSYPTLAPPFSPFVATVPLAAGASVLVPVPPFAKTVSFYRHGAADEVPPLIVYCNPDANLASIYQVLHVGVNNVESFEIDGQVQTLTIANVGANPIYYMAVVFDVTP